MLRNKPRGVRCVNDRRVLNGIFWVLRSGAPCRTVLSTRSSNVVSRPDTTNSRPTIWPRQTRINPNLTAAKESTPLILRVSRRSRKRNRIAHVGKAGHVGQGALEAQPEARVRHGAVTAQIAIPGVVLLIDAALGHARVQHFEPLLALTAADDLA